MATATVPERVLAVTPLEILRAELAMILDAIEWQKHDVELRERQAVKARAQIVDFEGRAERLREAIATLDAP